MSVYWMKKKNRTNNWVLSHSSYICLIFISSWNLDLVIFHSPRHTSWKKLEISVTWKKSDTSKTLMNKNSSSSKHSILQMLPRDPSFFCKFGNFIYKSYIGKAWIKMSYIVQRFKKIDTFQSFFNYDALIIHSSWTSFLTNSIINCTFFLIYKKAHFLPISVKKYISNST